MVFFFSPSDVHRTATSTYKPIYHEATKHLSSFVGHECLPEERSAREANYRESLNFVNSFCDLGLEKDDLDLFSLYFTALSDSRRFGGDKVMELVQGENPATHSLQAVCLKQRMFDGAAEALIGQKSFSPRMQIEHRVHSQMAGLAVMMHDMGEVLGEFTTAVQRMNDKNLKEDTHAEQTIFRYVLRMALEAQSKSDRESFYSRVSELKKQVKIVKEDGSAGGIPKSTEYLQQFLQPPITLSPEQEARFEKLTAIWDMAEGFHHPLHDAWEQQGINVGFVGQLTKSIDHVQGTRHLVRHARKGSIAQIPDYGADRSDIAHFDQNRTLGNMRYCEPEAGLLFAKLRTGQSALESVARQMVGADGGIYRTISDLMDVSPPVALGYQLDATRSAIVDAASPPSEPESPSVSLQKRAQGAMRGLYERAAFAALRGKFTPTMIENGKGGTRSQLLGIDGITHAQQATLYEGKTVAQGRGAA